MGFVPLHSATMMEHMAAWQHHQSSLVTPRDLCGLFDVNRLQTHSTFCRYTATHYAHSSIQVFTVHSRPVPETLYAWPLCALLMQFQVVC